MHEYGMVESLLTAVDERVRQGGGTRASRVVVSVGAVGGIEEHLLRDAFDLHKAGTSAAGAELAVDLRPVDALCPQCGTTTQVAAAGDRTCPDCGGTLLVSAQDADLALTKVEVEP